MSWNQSTQNESESLDDDVDINELSYSKHHSVNEIVSEGLVESSHLHKTLHVLIFV